MYKVRDLIDNIPLILELECNENENMNSEFNIMDVKLLEISMNDWERDNQQVI